MSSEKTEEPTPHKLRKAREEGQVPKSKDFTQTMLLAALFGYTLADSERLIRHLAQIIVMPSRLYGIEFGNAYGQAMSSMLADAFMLLLPYLLLVLVVGIFAETVQTGLIFSFKALKPKGEKLNPVNNLKQMFALKNIVEFIKSNLKVVALSTIVWMVLRNSLDLVVHVPPAGVVAAGVALGAILTKLVVFTFLLFSAIALADLVYQRHEYRKGLRMSIEEVSRSNERSTRAVTPPGISAAGLKKALTELGIIESKFGWGEIAERGMVLVSGPPAYVDLVQRAVMELPPMPPDQELAVFRLRYAAVDDRTIFYRDKQIITAGVASILRGLVSGDSSRSGTHILLSDIAAPLRTPLAPLTPLDRMFRKAYTPPTAVRARLHASTRLPTAPARLAAAVPVPGGHSRR